MKIFFKFILILSFLCTISQKVFAEENWSNDLKTLFSENKAVIYVINIRTFNAEDTNKNGLIENFEESGNFINAIARLDELNSLGINTIHVLPVTATGKIKALGTAGSLYAPSSFNKLNPQFDNSKNKLSVEEEATLFVDECHKRNIRVIFDVPSCGSYDMYLKNPQYFKKDKNKQPIIPQDWTDVRLLDENNPDVYLMYKDFIDMVISLGVDGVRADVATIKPFDFWQKLIKYAREKDPQFLFLAEAFDTSRESPSEYATFTPYNKLLQAGFDGYYGSYVNLKNWSKAKDLTDHVIFNQNLFKKYNEPKSVIGSFSTHDELSPILIKGPQFSKMIIWLNATLPLNSYFVDGFQTGDTYSYSWANKKAFGSKTDDDYYFVHKGKIDIFNFSRRLGGINNEILNEFILANKFKQFSDNVIYKGNFIPLKTSDEAVFAYSRSLDNKSVIVIGNLDFTKNKTKIKITVPKINSELNIMPIKMINISSIEKGKIITDLYAGEIQVMLINNFSLK